MPNKYYIHLCGGIGDHLLSYFGGKKVRQGPCKGLGYLQQLKKEQPDAIVKIISHPAAKGTTIEFFKHHPLIDSVEELGWWTPLKRCLKEQEESQGYTSLETYGIQRRWQTVPNTEIYLSEEDEREVQKVLDDGPFVLIHPFAGMDWRMPIEIGEYPEIIENIIRKFNCNVVLVGASHIKRDITPRTESFSYTTKRLFNLVEKTNIRVAVKLVQLAKAVVVTHSVMFCAASHGKIPCVILTSTLGITKQRFKISYLDKSRSVLLDCKDKELPNIKKELITCLQKVISAPK